MMIHRKRYYLLGTTLLSMLASIGFSGIANAAPVILENMWAQRHPEYASIIFQFSDRPAIRKPFIKNDELCIDFKNVSTELRRFRRYKSFASWVMFEKKNRSLASRIGLPEEFHRLDHFFLKNPHRLVVHLYFRDPVAVSLEEPPEAYEPPKEAEGEQKPSENEPKQTDASETEPDTSQKAALPAPGSPRSEDLAPAENPFGDQLTSNGLITMNFHDVDIRELLSALAIKREVNLVMSKDVSGKISLHLYRVDLEEAFRAITRSGECGFLKENDTYFVFKPKTERDPEADSLEMRVFKMQYGKIDKIQEVLDALPGKRMVKLHEPSKTLVVEDTPENIRKIETIIKVWDRKPKQVMIEAKILQIDLTDEMSFGVNWDKLLGNVRLATGGFSTAIAPTPDVTNPIASPVPSSGTGTFGNLISGAGTNTQLTLALDALQTKTTVNTLSTPKILAIHGETARVQVGGKQGYKTTTLSGSGLSTESVEFLDTGTILEITPFIDDGGNVLLNVKPSINSVTLDGATGIPTVTSTTVTTWLMAKSGETVFIAGLIEDSGSKVRKGVPCLSFLPGIGWLFGQTTNSIGKSELLVLISPQIVESELKQMDAAAVEKTRKVEEALHKKPSPIKDLIMGP